MHIGIDCRLFSSKFTGIGRYTHELVNHLIELNRKLKNPHKITLFFNNPEYKESKTSKHVIKILVNARHYSLKEQTVFSEITPENSLVDFGLEITIVSNAKDKEGAIELYKKLKIPLKK